MFAKYFASCALLTALCAPRQSYLSPTQPIADRRILDVSAAVTSLYVPGSSGVPFTADPIGTDSSGHTSWRVGIGAASGTFTATQDAVGPSGAFKLDLLPFTNSSPSDLERMANFHASPQLY